MPLSITENRDKVRLELGDTNEDNYLFNDDEIAYFLDVESDNIMQAVLRAAEAGARKLARAYDVQTDGQSFSRSQMAAALRLLAKDLRDQGVITTSASSSITTIEATKVDGYSDNVDNQDVRTTASEAWQKFYVVDGVDRIP